MSYLSRVAYASSQFINSIIPGAKRNEMLSSRAYRCRDKWYWAVVVAVLDTWFGVWFGDWLHCEVCYKHQIWVGEVL